jgi:pimeloyl-ACP methyl ester carboxylesterase
VLDSPVPNALTLGSEHARNLDESLHARFATCVADRQCRERFGDPAHTLQSLLEQLDAHPVDVTINDPVTHAARSEHLTRAGLAQLVRFYAYSPQTAALLPLTLDDARAGRYQALLGQLLLVQGDLSTRLDGPMELSVLCSEDASLLAESPSDAKTILGSAFVQQAQSACAAWPHAPMPKLFHTPLTGSVPTLILSGEFDPVTPPRYAHEIAAHLSQASVLVLPGQGHSVMGIGCAPDVVERFVSSASIKKLDAECLQREHATPFFLDYAGAAP